MGVLRGGCDVGREGQDVAGGGDDLQLIGLAWVDGVHDRGSISRLYV